MGIYMQELAATIWLSRLSRESRSAIGEMQRIASHVVRLRHKVWESQEENRGTEQLAVSAEVDARYDNLVSRIHIIFETLGISMIGHRSMMWMDGQLLLLADRKAASSRKLEAMIVIGAGTLGAGITSTQ